MKRSIIAIILALALLVAFAACGNGTAAEPTASPPTAAAEPQATTVTLLVTMPDGTQNTHNITTDKRTLGEALDGEGLIERDATGMIVKVAGVEASWENDQAYWSFEIDGQYATHGMDEELIIAGASKIYELKYTRD